MTPDEPTIKAAMPMPSPTASPVAATAPASLPNRLDDAATQTTIPLSQVRLHTNVRHVYDEAKTIELAGSIRMHGLLHRPVFRSLPDGGVELICGTRRHRAYQYNAERFPTETQWQHLPIDVRQIPDEAVATIQYIENEQRVSLPPVEIADHVLTMKGVLGWDEKTIASRFGWKDTRTVRYYLTIAESPAWLKLYATKHSIDVPKYVDGQIARDGEGHRITVSTETMPLTMAHLYELAKLFIALQKHDAKAAKLGQPPVAPKSTERLARRAALEEWSASKLAETAAAEIAKVTGLKTSTDTPERKPGNSTTTTKLHLDVSKMKEPLPNAELMEMKENIVTVLKTLGFKSVILEIPQ
jgi:ParB/RepB/Spo0J family partition protein